MTAKDITNQFRHSQRETERRRQFIMRMERKLAIKQRRNSRRHVPKNWFPADFSLGTSTDDAEFSADILKDL